MVKVLVPEPVLPMFITPSSYDGKLEPAKSINAVSPAVNPLTVTVTEEPTAPEVGLNDTVSCAFTDGVTITTAVSTLRKRTASITLLNLFFILIIPLLQINNVSPLGIRSI